jgi:hypothetical protein
MSVRSTARLLLVLCLGLAGRAWAQAGEPETSAKFQIFLAGSPDAKARVREELHELLARAGLTAEPQDVVAIDPQQAMAPGSPPAGVLGQVWLDLGIATNDQAKITLRDCGRQRVVVRSVPLPGGWDEVANEEIVHIVAASLVALAKGLPLEAPPEEEAKPSPPERTSWIAGLAAGGMRSSAGSAVAPALEASLLIAPRPRVALWSALALAWDSKDSSPISLRINEASLAILPTWVFWRSHRFQGYLGLGPGVGLLIVRPRLASGTAGVEPGDTDWAWQASLRAAARVDLRLARSFSIFLAATCDLALPRYRYTLTGKPEPVTLVETATLRPSLWLGLALDLAGGGPW